MFVFKEELSFIIKSINKKENITKKDIITEIEKNIDLITPSDMFGIISFLCSHRLGVVDYLDVADKEIEGDIWAKLRHGIKLYMKYILMVEFERLLILTKKNNDNRTSI